MTDDKLLRPSEVAAMFRVSTKTVWAWECAGKLQGLRTMGGHRRYREAQVRELLTAGDNATITPENGELNVT